jgi:hypothetical protein
MNEVRRLTPVGVQRFSAYLQACREGGTDAPPFELLTDPLASEACATVAPVIQMEFADRYEFGEWLLDTLAPFDATALSRDAGLWSWIGLRFFDQTSPARPDGSRKPGEDARHILPATYNYRKYYRHLAREAWLSARMHGVAIRPLLLGRLDTRGDVLEQLSSRLELFGNPAMMAAAVRLYVDALGKPTKLAAGKKGGSPRRLATLARQLTLTYDLRSTSPDQLISLLPQREFGSA